MTISIQNLVFVVLLFHEIIKFKLDIIFPTQVNDRLIIYRYSLEECVDPALLYSPNLIFRSSSYGFSRLCK